MLVITANYMYEEQKVLPTWTYDPNKAQQDEFSRLVNLPLTLNTIVALNDNLPLEETARATYAPPSI
jgi:hypothetical protein